MSYDASYSSVSLLLHGNGTNGGTVFTDNSPTPKTVTRSGGAITTTDFSVFGGSSLYLDGTGDYLSATITSAVGTGDFCAEAWIRPTSVAAAMNIACIGNAADTAQFNFLIDVTAGGGLRGSLQNGSNGTQLDISTASGLITAETWQHVAFTVSGTAGKLFIGGVQRASGTVSGTRVQARTEFRIGYLATDANRYFSGYIDDIRITKGVARYTSDFSVPTEEFPNRNYEAATAAVDLPKLTTEAYGGGRASVTLPKLTAASEYERHITADVVLPSLSPRITGHDSTGEQAAYITLPSLSVTITTGANSKATLPSLTASSTGTVTILADAQVTLPQLVVDSIVTVSCAASPSVA